MTYYSSYPYIVKIYLARDCWAPPSVVNGKGLLLAKQINHSGMPDSLPIMMFFIRQYFVFNARPWCYTKSLYTFFTFLPVPCTFAVTFEGAFHTPCRQTRGMLYLWILGKDSTGNGSMAGWNSKINTLPCSHEILYSQRGLISGEVQNGKKVEWWKTNVNVHL